jgi:membrane associated rhomboid family serine protease
MFICPKCNIQLTKTKGSWGIFWRCPSCDGRSATLAFLRKYVPKKTVNALWMSVRDGSFPQKRRCPACSNLMTEAPASGGKTTPYIDVCSVCQFVWFDTTEYEALPKIPRKPTFEERLPQEAREKLAMLELDTIREEVRGSDWGQGGPEQAWQWLPGILGMPVEQDVAPIRQLPWMTWLLALVISAISIMAFSDLRNAVQDYGLIPMQWGRYGGLTFLTSFFLHGGILHLLGNMYFFLVFGDNVEDYLGKWSFLLLLLCATVAGHALHIVGDPRGGIPCIGASGGISGIIVFYALKFPRARLGILVRIYMWFRWIRMPAYAMLVIWIGFQAFGVYMQTAGFSNVSSLAHLGGAAVGLLFWILTSESKPGNKGLL